MKTLKLEDLDQFTGSEHWYRHSLVRDVIWTDGIQHVAITGECFWLLDEIATAQLLPKVKGEEFQTWKLTVDLQSRMAVLRCEDGNNHLIYSKDIEYTDFPLPEITIWFTDNVMMLPSEY